MPASSRVRLPGQGEVAAALSAQWQLLVEAVDAMAPEALTNPVGLPGWRVSDLVAHLAEEIDGLVRRLEAPPPAGLPRLGLADCVSATPGMRGHGDPGRHAGPQLADRVARATGLLAELPEVRRRVCCRYGMAGLVDVLAGLCVDATGHAVDLAVATAEPPPLHPVAVSLAGRALAGVLLVRARGRSVELRIPGPAGWAVQCVSGPVHTRGKPANVVETDARSWLELATGRLGWATALAAGTVRASGERADLSGWLPLSP